MEPCIFFKEWYHSVNAFEPFSNMEILFYFANTVINNVY